MDFSYPNVFIKSDPVCKEIQCNSFFVKFCYNQILPERSSARLTVKLVPSSEIKFEASIWKKNFETKDFSAINIDRLSGKLNEASKKKLK